MDGTHPHDWFAPRLAALVAEADKAGYARDVTVAVITDLINGPAYNNGPEVDEENWNQDIGEPDYMVNQDATQGDGGVGGGAGGLEGLEHFPLRHRGRRT
jgi:hypothetical protein